MLARERDGRRDDVSAPDVAVQSEDDRLVFRAAVVRVFVDLVVRRDRARVRGVSAPVHVADRDLVAAFRVDALDVEEQARRPELGRETERRLCGLRRLELRSEKSDGGLGPDAGVLRVVRVERELREPEQRSVRVRIGDAARDAVLLQLGEERHHQVSTREEADPAARDAGSGK